MGLSQRQKGAAAEREVATILQGWWRHLEPQCRFVRVPLSGGWHGPAVRREFKASGDVMTTAQHFPFTVEIKRREGWADSTLFAGKDSPVWAWWLQAQTQGIEQGAVPMLWIRRSRQPWRVLVPEAWWREMDFAIPRASHQWPGRWLSRRGLRPIMHYEVHVTSIAPRQFVRQLKRG